MIIGYARVSREDQDLGRQVKALQDSGCEKIFEDKISGAKAKRPQLDALLSSLGAGDVVVVQKLDRLGRSLIDLINLVNVFKAKGVGFKSLTDSIDTTSAHGMMVFHMMGAMAEFEREMIRERTRDALAFKKSQGVVLGRPVKVETELKAEFGRLKKQGMDRDAIKSQLSISQYKYYSLNSSYVNPDRNWIDELP